MAGTSVNPLEERFERKKIRLLDFFNPEYIPHKNKDFKKCELTGPGLVYFDGLHAERVFFRHVQIVVISAKDGETKTVWGSPHLNDASLSVACSQI